MIIVPTEKQFDWQHAPLVLFCIVLLNIFTYFLYQSGDNSIAVTTITDYQDRGYAEKEWPLFEKYLTSTGELDTLSEYRQLVDENYEEEVAVQMLLRQDFYNYLQEHAQEIFSHEDLSLWEVQRAYIQKDFNSLSSIAHGLSAKYFKLSALITHQFLHGDTMHLLGNMFFLIICGFAVEAAIGHWRFLLFYLVSGIGAGLAQVVADMNSMTPLVGASGAISGVMAMYLAIFRLRKIEFFYWVFFLVGYIRAPALLILPFYIGKELMDFYTNPDSNVAFLAHAGGFVCGGALIGLSLLFKLRIVNTEYVDADTNIKPEQEKMAAIYKAIEDMRFERALTLVSELTSEQGDSFTLTKIRYNLLKLKQGEGFDHCLTQLLSFKNLRPHEIAELERVWREHSTAVTNLNDQTKLKLGLQFSTLDSPRSAEALTEALVEQGYRNPDLILLTQKMEGIFDKLGNQSKKAKFAALAQQLKKESHHGVL